MPAKGIRERYEYLLKFLSELTPTDECVLWRRGGSYLELYYWRLSNK